MSEQLRATKFFLDKVKKLYPTFQYPDEIDIDLWTEVLDGHSQTDILEALKAYRRDTEYNKAPNPAEFKKFLATKSDNQGMRARILKCADELGEKYGKSVRDKYLANYPDYDFSSHSWKEPKMLPLRNGIADYAVSLMQRDIRLGSCRHLLPVYQKAVRYVAEELLLEVIPSEQWRHMTYGERCKAAKEKGLFDRLSEVLVQVCRQNYGKDYQFESKSQMNQQFDMTDKIKRIASHYRTDEAEMARAAGL